jgi:chromosome segregation ATPase
MIATIVGVLTSRLAGPIATTAAVALALALGWQTFHLSMTKGSLERSEKRAETLTTDLRTCRGNTRALEASIASQNEALTAMQREGEARAAEIEKGRQQARKEAERADRAAAALAKLKPAGNDLCARMLAVDEAVKEATR